MKKILVVLLAIVLILSFVTPAFASGGQVTGDKGQGATHEEFENGCDDQPCFDVAEQPKNGKN